MPSRRPSRGKSKSLSMSGNNTKSILSNPTLKENIFKAVGGVGGVITTASIISPITAIPVVYVGGLTGAYMAGAKLGSLLSKFKFKKSDKFKVKGLYNKSDIPKLKKEELAIKDKNGKYIVISNPKVKKIKKFLESRETDNVRVLSVTSKV